MITGEEAPWPAWGAGNREGVRAMRSASDAIVTTIRVWFRP